MRIEKPTPSKGKGKPVKISELVGEEKVLGRPALTETYITANEALVEMEKGVNLKELVKATTPSPGRGRAFKDADNLRISGSREFVIAALPLFKKLLEQDTYVVHIDTHEKRDSKGAPTGKYITYIRLREKVDPLPMGRPRKTQKEELVKAVAKPSQPSPKKSLNLLLKRR